MLYNPSLQTLGHILKELFSYFSRSMKTIDLIRNTGLLKHHMKF